MSKARAALLCLLLLWLADGLRFFYTQLPLRPMPYVWNWEPDRPLLNQLPAMFPVQRDRYYFASALSLIAYWRPKRVGEYAFEPSLTYGKALLKIARGKRLLHRLTFIEGTRFQDWRRLLAGHPALKHETAQFSDAALMKLLTGRDDLSPEGYFFPDTYSFYRGTSEWVILRLAARQQAQQCDKIWAERAPGLPYRTPYELVILASLVEKEAHRADERAVIAGVFVRRLQRGMRLQSDPTILYALGVGYDHRITKSELKMDAPYNTYRVEGLPPTAIAMPGSAALYAAAHPASGDALYFVARGDGSHQFSATLAEHEAAVSRYQRKS